MPQRPLSTLDLWDKFRRLTAALPTGRVERFFARMLELENVPNVAEIDLI